MVDLRGLVGVIGGEVRAITNILKFAAERSPAAPNLKEWRSDFAAGGAKRDLGVAKMLLGTGLGMTAVQ